MDFVSIIELAAAVISMGLVAIALIAFIFLIGGEKN